MNLSSIDQKNRMDYILMKYMNKRISNINKVEKYLKIIEKINNNFIKHHFTLRIIIQENNVFIHTGGDSKKNSLGNLNDTNTLKFLENYIRMMT